jgi:FKBP-type peptidyl-prolyl cis-trans isomerase
MRLGPRLLALVLVLACKRAAPPAPPPSTVVVAPTIDLAPPPDARATPTGLRTKVLNAGTGTEHPEQQDLVEIHYTGWKSDGTQFDDSRSRNAPAQFKVEDAIKGWSEALTLMVVGEKRRIWVPPALAYGEHPGKRAPAGPLVFELELLRIIKRPRPIPPPPDLAAPPARAARTKLGLGYRVLEKGRGAKHPRPDSFVEFHYTTWDAVGHMVETTTQEGDPSKTRVQTAGRVWTDLLSNLVVGEKARFWIPASLAAELGGLRPAAVCDVELLSVR